MGVVKHKTISSSAIGHSGAHWRKLRTTFGYGAYFLIAIRSISSSSQCCIIVFINYHQEERNKNTTCLNYFRARSRRFFTLHFIPFCGTTGSVLPEGE
jgi:hypothetical protein